MFLMTNPLFKKLSPRSNLDHRLAGKTSLARPEKPDFCPEIAYITNRRPKFASLANIIPAYNPLRHAHSRTSPMTPGNHLCLTRSLGQSLRSSVDRRASNRRSQKSLNSISLPFKHIRAKISFAVRPA
jgi:hypothetical protein